MTKFSFGPTMANFNGTTSSKIKLMLQLAEKYNSKKAIIMFDFYRAVASAKEQAEKKMAELVIEIEREIE